MFDGELRLGSGWRREAEEVGEGEVSWTLPECAESPGDATGEDEVVEGPVECMNVVEIGIGAGKSCEMFKFEFLSI